MWRRLAMALPISLLIHILVLLLGRPDYQEVSDYAVDLEVVEMAPGKPATSREPATVPEEKPATEPEEVPQSEEIPQPEIDNEVGITAIELPDEIHAFDAGVVAAGASDGGQSAVAVLVGDGGVGSGSGICFHDVFPFAKEDPSWILWVSMSSFNNTIFESGLARTLGSFSLYKDMAGATGVDPHTEVEGFLVTADDFADWKSYRVIATYNSGEENLRRRLEKNRGKERGFSWKKTEAGYEGAIPGTYRWHLVGSGRVLAVTHEPLTSPAPMKKKSVFDAGLTSAPSAHLRDAGSQAASPKRKPVLPSFPDWPRQVACMAPEHEAGPGSETPKFTALVRSSLGPDPEGHWPAALIATNDPKAVGLSMGHELPVRFRWVIVKAFFSDPIRLQGVIRFDGTPEEVAAVEKMWRHMVIRASSDPFMAMAGLGHIFDKLEIEAKSDRIEFKLPMTESQVQASLLFLQLQAEALDDKIGRHRGKNSDGN